MEPNYQLVIEDDYEYKLTQGYMKEMVPRFIRMLFKTFQRSDRQNLSIDQFAKWYDMEKDRLGKSKFQRCRIKLTVLWNVISAAVVCLIIARRVKLPIKWSMKLDILASDFWLDELVNRHKIHPEKVELFMCMQEILDIPIVISEYEGKYFIQDGNHRYAARKKRGFMKIRAITV